MQSWSSPKKQAFTKTDQKRQTENSTRVTRLIQNWIYKLLFRLIRKTNKSGNVRPFFLIPFSFPSYEDLPPSGEKVAVVIVKPLMWKKVDDDAAV